MQQAKSLKRGIWKKILASSEKDSGLTAHSCGLQVLLLCNYCSGFSEQEVRLEVWFRSATQSSDQSIPNRILARFAQPVWLSGHGGTLLEEAKQQVKFNPNFNDKSAI